MIGTKGYWIDDNDYCEIIGVIDESAGVYEFQTLSPEEFHLWRGFIEHFSPELQEEI